MVASECVQFDTELPEYRTEGGVHGKDSRDGRITSPTLMWVKAVDMLMDKIRIAGIDFSQVAAISGAGQVSLFSRLSLINNQNVYEMNILRKESYIIVIFLSYT